jgi:hypothetical protein
MSSALELATKDLSSLIELANSKMKSLMTPIYNVKGYGAGGDGVADDTEAISFAINAAEEVGGGIVFLPEGTYLISSKLTINKPVYIIGVGKGDDTSNANSTDSDLGVTNIKWIGSGDTMIEFKSSTTNNYLVGGGVIGLILDGNGIAKTGIHGASIAETEYKSLHIRKVTSQGILIDSANGVLSKHNFIEDYHFVWGTTTASENAHALVLGNLTDGLTTQTHVLSMNGLVKNGHFVLLRGTDNNIFEKVHGVVQSGGTGKSVYFENGVKSARNNLINYLVGPVHAESTTYGNRIIHYISEAGGISIDSGAQIHYTAEDYVNAELFDTHKYVMSDQKDIPVGAMAVVSGSAVAGIAAAQWACFDLPDSANSRIGLFVPPVYSWNNGKIKTLRIWFTSNTANTSTQWRATIKALINSNGFGLATPEFNTSYNIPVKDSQNLLQYFDVPLELDYATDEAINISIERLGADANDTASGKIQIFGATLIYQGTGPDSAGSGTYDVTPPFK